MNLYCSKKTTKYKKYSKIKKFFGFCIITLISSALILLTSIYLFEKQILPSLMDISHMRSKTIANQILDTSMKELLETTPITNDYFLTESNNQMIINSQNINSFCSELSLLLGDKINDLSQEIIEIPIGSATQLNYFEESGISIPFRLFPIGLVTSDYETEFISAGINQTNYKIWIYVTIEIQIANPFLVESVMLNKKIMLVDTIIRGDVPIQYMTIPENLINDY